jgi:hypothetical protein
MVRATDVNVVAQFPEEVAGAPGNACHLGVRSPMYPFRDLTRWSGFLVLTRTL